MNYPLRAYGSLSGDNNRYPGCIDKSSSAELSEAINSMYDWYKAARRCYAYLNDCSIPSKPEWEVIVRDSAARLNKYFRWDRLSFRLRPPLIDPVKCICMGHREEYKQEQRDSMYDLLKHCRWFTRGWTLQELIAPKQVIFHDRHWQMVAKRRDILLTLEEITGIHKEALEPSFFGSDDSLSRFSIAQRMYWASSRHTTREEDAAYCLLGIFQINMPLLYGEGERAFKRLQEEIMKATPDQSIFAWEHPDNRFWIDSSLLAESTFYFQGARNIRYAGWDENLPLPGSEFRMTHQGLEIELWIDEYRLQHNYNTQVAALDCVLEQPDGHSSRVGLFLFQSPINSWQSHSDGAYPTHIVFNRAEQRMWDRRLLKLPLSWTSRPLSKRKLLIADDDLWHRVKCYDVQIEMDFLQKREVLSARWRILATYPRFQWSDRTLKLPDIDNACGGVAIDSLDYGTIFIILGVDTDIPRHTCNPFSHDRSYKYWILKELEPDPGISPSSSTLRSRNEDGFSPRTEQRVLQICALEKYEFYLEKLCDCASTFGAKDFFEHTTRRTESHKSIVLPDNKVLRASFNKSMEAPGLYDAPYRPSKMLLRLHVEPGSEESSISSDEDYFRLRNIERLFLTELTERRKWEWC